MAVLQASSGGQEGSFGAPGTGAGTDVEAELERLRSNLAALAEVVEEIRSKYGGHRHGGVVAAPPVGEQVSVSYTMH